MSQPRNLAVTDTDRTVTDLGLARVSRENSGSGEEKVEVIQFGTVSGIAQRTGRAMSDDKRLQEGAENSLQATSDNS
jgi:hypothetical protein